MPCPDRAFLDPLLQQCDLPRLEFLVLLPRRHHFFFILRGDPLEQFALFHVARHDRRFSDFAGAKADSFSSSRSFALRLFASGPWQAKQCSEKIGRISRAKSISPMRAPWKRNNGEERDEVGFHEWQADDA
jgi:hypothetical protein